MAELLPFRGVRFGPQVSDLARALCPPYHVLASQEVARYYLRSPYNAVRLEHGMDQPDDHALFDRHTRATLTWGDWLAEGVLIRDRLPSYYLYERRTARGPLRGILGLVRPEDLRVTDPEGESAITDRLAHLKALQAQVGPLTCRYEDPDQLLAEALLEASAEPPMNEGVDSQGERHRLWRAFPGPGWDRSLEILRDQILEVVAGAACLEAARRIGHQQVLAILLDAADPAWEPASGSAPPWHGEVPVGLVCHDLLGSPAAP